MRPRAAFRIARSSRWVRPRWWALALVMLLALTDGGAVATAQTGNVTFTVQVVDANGLPTVNPVLSGYQFCLRPGGALPGPACVGNNANTAVVSQATNASGFASVTVPQGEYALLNATSGAEVVRFLLNGATVSTIVVPNGGTLALTAVVRQGDQFNGTLTIQVQVNGADGVTNSGADLSGFQFCVVARSTTAAQCQLPNILTPATNSSGVTTVTVPRGVYTLLAPVRSGLTFDTFLANGQTLTFLNVTAGVINTVTARFTGALPVGAATAGSATTATVVVTTSVVGSDGLTPVPGSDLSGFQFTLACGSGFSRSATSDSTGRATIDGVPPGTCTLTQATRAGSSFVGLFVGGSASNAGNGGSLTVSANQLLNVIARNSGSSAGGGATVVAANVPTSAAVTNANSAMVTVSLFPGCNNITSTWDNGTSVVQVLGGLTPISSVTAIWIYQGSEGRFFGFSTQPGAPADLRTIDRNSTLQICLNESGQLQRPA